MNTDDDIKVKISFVCNKSDIPAEVSDRLSKLDFRNLATSRNLINSLCISLNSNTIEENDLKVLNIIIDKIQNSLETLITLQEIIKGYIKLDNETQDEVQEPKELKEEEQISSRETYND